MKKLGLAILAAATLVASCTKMDVALENENEIGFAPATKNVTKAGAMAAGALNENETLGVWAFWDQDGAVEDAVKGTVDETPYDHYPNYTETYLNNAMFKKVGTTWAGWDGTAHSPYTWPSKGALVFAGYNVPANGNLTSVTYTLNDNTATGTDETNTMTFIGYKQSNYVNETFDLCWFERTAGSYNNRVKGQAIEVTMKHALSWLTFYVKGEGSATGSWEITQMTLKGIATTGTGVCTSTATWDVTGSPTADMVIFQGATSQTLTNALAPIGSATGIVVIPQETTNIKLEIAYKYLKPQTTDEYITETGTIDLTSIAQWEAGVKYTYNLTFKANEILIDPLYGVWSEAPGSNIVVE